MKKQTRYILFLEQDAQDRELSVYYFNQKQIPVLFLYQSNEVLPLLHARLRDKAALPSMILLSMHSVPETGLDVLKELRSEKELAHIPVVVLGENTQPDLVRACYEAGASTFINKPFTNKLTDLKVKAFLQYWFEVAELPQRFSNTPAAVV